MASQKAGKASFPSFRRKPESRFFEQLQDVWTPVTLSRRKPGTGVTTSCEAVNFPRWYKNPVYLPLNWGGRFSMKALTASIRSSLIRIAAFF